MFTRALLAGIALAITTVSASAFCSEPDAPYCALRYGPFDDEYDFDRCKREMELYRNDVEDFLDCTKREVSELHRKIIELNHKANEAADDFRVCAAF
ncbi:MAG: hypothetical protein ACR2GC_09060 [Methyloceanibacter sp.]|uniref:hypothetical protein n=1 Tax=Methyloceanibacter sp. TaxID=1965321 RepID=UPI003D9BD2B6